MLKKNYQNKAIMAIQDLIIEARTLAYNNTSQKKMAEFLDGIEYLPALLLEENDNTELFENYLKELCNKFNCLSVLNKYNRR